MCLLSLCFVWSGEAASSQEATDRFPVQEMIIYVTGFRKTLRNLRFAQCAFLVAQVKICQCPDFVMYMLNNPSCAIQRRNKPSF